MKINFNNDWEYKDGTKWCPVTLPHDAMINSERNKNASGGGACAYYNGGIYEYIRKFDFPKKWLCKDIYLLFEGIYQNSTIYLNDIKVGECAYGYTRFLVKLENIKEGQNEIHVIADNSKAPNSRWYTGGGIYRPVTMIIKDKYSFVPDSIYIKTIDDKSIEISSDFKGDAKFSVLDNDKVVASRNGNGIIEIKNAILWDETNPHLYKLKAEIIHDNKTVDEEIISFGMRIISYSEKGFFINGKKVLFRGACIHHDNGILGSCAYDEVEERKAEILKKAGYNAIRSAHNPCSTAFLNACDRLGLYVLDEAFDMWYMHKKKYDYASYFDKWHDSDLESMVLKDRNHPSVIAYSIGNEVSEPAFDKGLKIEKQMIDLLHSLDNRPVTAGINLFIVNGAYNGKGIYDESKVMNEGPIKEEKPTSSTLFNLIASNTGTAMNKMSNSSKVDKIVSPCLDMLDIAGYNYASGRYKMEAKAHPKRLIFGSETFPQDIYKNWEMVKKYSYLCGDFMWTGWDYLGEVGIGGWCYETQYGFNFEKPYPWIIADCGTIDILGNIGAQAKYASVVWGLTNSPIIAVKPCNHPNEKLVKAVWRGTNAIESWSWNKCNGNKTEVEVYSNADKIVLCLNGKELAKKKVKENKAIFKACYQPGKIEAIALDKKGSEISRSSLLSINNPKLHIECEKFEKDRVCFFPITLEENGIIESNDFRSLTLNVTGGKLLAFGSAEQKTLEKYSSNKTNLYYGRAMAIIRVLDNKVTLNLTDGNNNIEKTFSI